MEAATDNAASFAKAVYDRLADKQT
jgi:hypothetical protein